MPFDSGFEEVIQRSSDLGKVGDETTVEVGETLKRAIFRNIGRDFPIPNTGDFDWVHHDCAIFKNYAKEFNPFRFENALAGFQEQIQLL